MESDVATLANGSRFEGRYEILGVLGSSRFGDVYHARQLSTGQSVAIKLLSPREGTDQSSASRDVERFRRETQICAALSNVHIVRLIDSGETRDGRLYAVFAYVPGETLEQAVSRDGALGVREAVRLMTQVLEALRYAHAKGVVHRDLKPSNLMLSDRVPRRDAVVLDFGVGGLTEGWRRADWETESQAREFVGTPLYASPEQLAGEAATPSSDLYAWGLIFLECLTGRRPFPEAGAAARSLTGGDAVDIPAWLRGHRLGELLETVTAREAAKRDLPVEALIEGLDEIARGELPEAPEEVATPAPLPDAGVERRHLTVMFCDVVGATALSRQLDAEAYRRIVQAYEARSVKAIERHDGHVVQHLGDGLLVYFGYPQAHGDDPERAVRAGRDILRDLRTLNTRLEAEYGLRLAVRVGIHTGTVVVGEMGGGEKCETLALGDTPNIAARLQAVAAPDTVVISHATRRLVAGGIVSEDLGTPPLKGITEPLRLHRVIQTLPRPLTPMPRTPFVGREEELGLLLGRFAQAQEMRGQALWIAGEPGIGKSRLVQRLRERLGATAHGWLECRCSPYTPNSALAPLTELVEQALRLDDLGNPGEKVSRLEFALELAGLALAETVPLFTSLLSLRLPERYAPLEISPQLQRKRTLEALLAWVLALGEKQPLVLVVEDLQWIDPSTLEWLGLLIEQCPTAAALVLLTFRPEFEPPWPAHAHLQPIVLSRLKHKEARALVVASSSGAALPEALVDQIATRSDGVPLFVEELARSAVRGRELMGALSDLEIPETLQDSLMARLDRLETAKQVAQLGAALGREFSYTLLEAVAPLKETALRDGLGRLVTEELVYQRGLPPKAVYTFKHALVQDTAYQSLLASQRRELHGRVANALEKHFPERVEREPEMVARHCEEAGLVARAIGHYQRAGGHAMEHFAAEEAIAHLHGAIELLRTLPESRERNELELQLQLALTAPLGVGKGYAHPEVERVHARARELCQAIGERPELFRAFLGLAAFYTVRGELRTATALGEQALQLAVQVHAVPDLLLAHDWLGITLQLRGEFARSLEHHEEAIRLYDPPKHRYLAHVWGHDPGIHARSFAASTLGFLGHPDRARRMSRETVELARQGDPYSLSIALAYSAILYRQFDGRARVREAANEAVAIAREQGFPYPLALATLPLGQAVGGTLGLQEIQRAVAWFEGVGWGTTGFYLPLAEATRDLGQTEDALAALETAFAVSEKNDNPYYDAEFHRLRGEILLERDEPEQAERSFRRALEIARKQVAKCFELRAATSLARLLRDEGRPDEAPALLAPVYDWFTEGFDTADLKDAKALLDELQPRTPKGR